MHAMGGETWTCKCSPSRIFTFSEVTSNKYRCEKCQSPLITELENSGKIFTFKRVPIDELKPGDVMIVGHPRDEKSHPVIRIKINKNNDTVVLLGKGNHPVAKGALIGVELAEPRKL